MRDRQTDRDRERQDTEKRDRDGERQKETERDIGRDREKVPVDHERR